MVTGDGCVDTNRKIVPLSPWDQTIRSFNEQVCLMLFRKSKPIPAPPQPRHSFRMKAVGTEFEAHGLGLIVAAMAVVLILTAIIFGGAATTQAVGGIVQRFAQAEPAPLEKPPPD